MPTHGQKLGPIGYNWIRSVKILHYFFFFFFLFLSNCGVLLLMVLLFVFLLVRFTFWVQSQIKF